ncbi:MAG: hypothetical protein COA57_13405 [Flavobacteriales bacterium]|nr:DUF2807 domain-containing protein [Bacteroidales bacterium AH-315-I05]PCJ82162.1 MAG: hypothetical protein COA57_13405 [Flavobacteriales bacterium]
MKKTLCLHLSLTVILICFSNCKKEEPNRCLKNAGENITEKRDACNFSYLDVKDHLNVIIKQESACQIELKGGAKLLPYIKTEVIGDTLYISNENQCNWLRDYEKQVDVSLSVNDLKKITFSGSGEISSLDTIRVSAIEVWLKGATGSVNLSLEAYSVKGVVAKESGDLTLSGRAEWAALYAQNTNGRIICENFETNSTYIYNDGTADCSVYANNWLQADIHYIGSVYYKGSPGEIIESVTGKGKLIKHR